MIAGVLSDAGPPFWEGLLRVRSARGCSYARGIVIIVFIAVDSTIVVSTASDAVIRKRRRAAAPSSRSRAQVRERERAGR